jgi:hypothetical protein
LDKVTRETPNYLKKWITNEKNLDFWGFVSDSNSYNLDPFLQR